MVLITYTANDPDVGIGVGGAFAIVGGALLLNYFLIARHEGEAEPVWTPRGMRPPEPPTPPAP